MVWLEKKETRVDSRLNTNKYCLVTENFSNYTQFSMMFKFTGFYNMKSNI